MEELPAQVKLMRDIATEAHKGQTRKFGLDKGLPYIVHPTRVAAELQGEGVIAWAAGFGHDVVEDCGLSKADLIAKGVLPEIAETVEIVSRQPSVWSGGYAETYLEFILRIKNSDTACFETSKVHDAAMKVKIADIKDNMYDLHPGNRLDKYEMALYILTH